MPDIDLRPTDPSVEVGRSVVEEPLASSVAIFNPAMGVRIRKWPCSTT